MVKPNETTTIYLVGGSTLSKAINKGWLGSHFEVSHLIRRDEPMEEKPFCCFVLFNL